jgi:hypothetical protein
MRRVLRFTLAIISLALLVAGPAFAQAPTTVALTSPPTSIVLTPISSTAAINTATVLTIPAPAGGLYNYVCYLAFQMSTDTTGGTVTTNAASTSANFNAFAIKVSESGVSNHDTGVQVVLGGMSPGTGCAKSLAPGVITTFTSPTPGTHTTFTWYATYFQAP